MVGMASRTGGLALRPDTRIALALSSAIRIHGWGNQCARCRHALQADERSILRQSTRICGSSHWADASLTLCNVPGEKRSSRPKLQRCTARLGSSGSDLEPCTIPKRQSIASGLAHVIESRTFTHNTSHTVRTLISSENRKAGLLQIARPDCRSSDWVIDQNQLCFVSGDHRDKHS
jgi:hypothetical protein